MKRGVATSLAYGYHKDTTLSNLIEMVSILDRYHPEKTLARSAGILDMIKWTASKASSTSEANSTGASGRIGMRPACLSRPVNNSNSPKATSTQSISFASLRNQPRL